MKPRSFSLRSWLPLLILFLASALTYLPFVPQIGFSNDDWYLVYGAHVRGPEYFAPAYDRDRPMRALILAPEYSLFGDNPLPYHLTMYGFRLLGALSLLWFLNQLWPKNVTAHSQLPTSSSPCSSFSTPASSPNPTRWITRRRSSRCGRRSPPSR